MKILMLTPYLPYPLLSGGQIRTYNLLKNLKDKHEIHLYALIKEEVETQYIPKLAEFCKKVEVFQRSRTPFTLRNVLLAGVTPYPFVVTRNLPRSAKSVLTKALDKERFDLIHAETFYVMPNIPDTDIPTLLVEQTIEYLVYQDFAKNNKIPFLKPFLMFDIQKIKYWEKHYWEKATRLATMSEEDRNFILQFVPQAKIDVVANGIDADYFREVKRRPPAAPVVLFVGQFKWLPNRDAVQFIHQEIWPQVKREVPNAKLWIVGRHPSPEIRALANQKDIAVDDKIADIRSAYAAATVLLAPIRSGRGTKYKIIEAMASGTPVVATPLGIEGIKAKDGQEVLIGENSQELTRKTVDVVRDPQRATKIAKAAKKLILRRYNWEIISARLDEIYRELGRK